MILKMYISGRCLWIWQQTRTGSGQSWPWRRTTTRSYLRQSIKKNNFSLFSRMLSSDLNIYNVTYSIYYMNCIFLQSTMVFVLEGTRRVILIEDCSSQSTKTTFFVLIDNDFVYPFLQISAWNMELTWAWNISLNHNLVADMFIGTKCDIQSVNANIQEVGSSLL